LSLKNYRKITDTRNQKTKNTPVTRSIRIVRPSFQHHSTRLRTPRPTVPESPAQSASFSSRRLLEVRLSKINKKILKKSTHTRQKKPKTPVTRSIRIVRPSFAHHSTRLRAPRPTVPESPAQSAAFSSSGLLEVRDDGVAVRLLLEARKDHLGVGNVLLGVLKVPMQFFCQFNIK
jgi:hypothetical protein